MISKIERTIALRYLKPKKKEGFLKVISIFSFLGIALGVAILIIVMSVMNGFRTELISKIIGFNAHVTVKPYDKSIDSKKLKNNNLINISDDLIFTNSGESVLINKDFTKGQAPGFNIKWAERIGGKGDKSGWVITYDNKYAKTQKGKRCSNFSAQLSDS